MRVPMIFHPHRRRPDSIRQLLVKTAICLFASLVAFGWPLPRGVAVPLPSVTASAATASGAATPSPVQPEHRTFLWSVSSSSATVYLLGSVHVASPAVYPLDPRIESAFDGADTLVLEMALDPATQVQVGQKLAIAGTYPAGDTIDLHLNRESLQLLQQRLTQSGAPFNSIRSFRPWFVAMLFTLSELQRLGYRPDLGIDVYFAGKARNRKRILGLETSDEQVALFAGMTETAQEQMLKEALSRLDELGEYMERALRFWRLGDTKAMDGLLVAPIRKDYPDMYQKIFADRSRKMADAVEGYLKGTGVYFVLVGSGHLTGPDGVLELLQGKGYVAIQQ